MKSFSAIEAVKFGWTISKKKWHLFFTIGGLNILLSVILGIPDLIFGKATSEANLFILVLYIPFFLVSIIISAGLIKIPVLLASGLDAKFSDIWVTNWRLLLKYTLASILSGLIVLGGFILLIIPGIIFSMKLMLVPYFVIDKELGPIEAIKASWNATKGNLSEIILLGVLNFLVIIAGILALFIGLIWAIPTAMVATAYAYRKLSGKVTSTSELPLQV